MFYKPNNIHIMPIIVIIVDFTVWYTMLLYSTPTYLVDLPSCPDVKVQCVAHQAT